jgi:predicted transcriptional regulator with HTH domain
VAKVIRKKEKIGEYKHNNERKNEKDKKNLKTTLQKNMYNYCGRKSLIEMDLVFINSKINKAHV